MRQPLKDAFLNEWPFAGIWCRPLFCSVDTPTRCISSFNQIIVTQLPAAEMCMRWQMTDDSSYSLVSDIFISKPKPYISKLFCWWIFWKWRNPVHNLHSGGPQNVPLKSEKLLFEVTTFLYSKYSRLYKF
jgi:hypothetical protein